MDIIYVHDGVAYVAKRTNGYCCGPGWDKDGCQVNGRSLCNSIACSASTRGLEKSLGYPIGWRSLGPVPIEGKHMYVVDFNETFEVVQREDLSVGCHRECSAFKKGVCRDYCERRADEALCVVLGEVLGLPKSTLKRIR